MRDMRKLLLLFLVASACKTVTTPPPAPDERRYTILLVGNRAGTQVTRVANGVTTIEYEYTDRGRGPKITTVISGDSLTNTGVNYLKSPVNETVGRPFNSLNGPPEELGLYAKDLLAAGDKRVEKIGELTLNGKHVSAYAVSGLDFLPIEVWLEDDGTFFAAASSWLSAIREGYESSLKALTDLQDNAAAARGTALARQLQHKPANGLLVIRNARVFDSEAARMLPPQTIVIRGDRIESVGTASEPANAKVIDAAGKTVIPGLWDMHVHIASGDGLLDIAAGVTSVRDMANDTDFLEALRKKYDAGIEVGPRVVAAGFMDGPGPFAGPTKVLVSTEDEVRAAVDKYKALGYKQIKIYSSIKPELVPFIAEYTHDNNMRLSGHIPAFMNAETAVRDGFDEIQHINMLFLNFLRDVQDTRTPQRFIAVAERANEVDLNSPEMNAFIDLLRQREVVVDPTLVVYEQLFVARPGKMTPVMASIADRFPAQVRRQLFRGGLQVPEGKDATYRQSFVQALALTKRLYDAGIRLVAGTDGMAGFALPRELELYENAGIPAPKVLQLATLGAAQVAGRDRELGSITAGKLADLVIIDGDPVANISDIRKIATVIKGGVIYEAAEVERAIGMTGR
jgi:imidazolonepropionase-like amidohydrolase